MFKIKAYTIPVLVALACANIEEHQQNRLQQLSHDGNYSEATRLTYLPNPTLDLTETTCPEQESNDEEKKRNSLSSLLIMVAIGALEMMPQPKRVLRSSISPKFGHYLTAVFSIALLNLQGANAEVGNKFADKTIKTSFYESSAYLCD